MINNSFLYELNKTLDSSQHFSSNDFNLVNDFRKFRINYAYNDEYFFELDIPSEISNLTKTEVQSQSMRFITTEKQIKYQEYEFSGTKSPGSIAQKEKFIIEGKSILISHINNWLANLWNELTIQPQLRNINEIEKNIQELNETFADFSEDFFTREEASKLSDKLDELENQFKEKLEQEINDKEILVEALKELHNEIEKLKAQSKVLNKKNWLISFGGKIFNWVAKEENRKFLKDTKDFIKGFLPDSL